MDLTVDQFIDGLLSKEAYETPSDTVKEDDLEMNLPEWFDENLYNRGRSFFWRFCFGLSGSMTSGLISVFSVPTILAVLVGSRRSSSKYTAFKRYLSTFLHVMSWFRYDLKPGTVSWRSLYEVRRRHLKSGRAARLKNKGTVSQRDLALTQFGFLGYAVLKPDRIGVNQQEADDWEAYNHLWRVIGHMLGIEDRYNICRKNIEETREVCRLILERVYTPCLENVPEYFEHMARVMMDGMWTVNGTMESGSQMYLTKNLANVPGYILTEAERIDLQRRIKEKLNGKHPDIGVDASLLVEKARVEGLPERPPRLLYLKDYDTLDNAPEYKKLSLAAKYKLALFSIFIAFYNTNIGRVLINSYFVLSINLTEYFPYVAFFVYGIKNSYVNIFKESPLDDTPAKPNSEYNKPQQPIPWYKAILAFW
ncbi:uncharacterized protein LOC106709945 [Papilio machaon]|uniref:uncharacterized protein LOC106709945 n=1 Tax=Papilio machaon TaxID=76193 RepID=UPI001E66594E|nr:uncharacterized protein LOC106709945 [Papilio machaon]